LAQGNLLTDKYAEGFAGHRFYAGCDNVDTIENEASELACRLFDADHAYVQPHSGADANLVAFSSILAAKTEAPFLAKTGDGNPAHLTRDQWNQLRARLQGQRLLALDYYRKKKRAHHRQHRRRGCPALARDPSRGSAARRSARSRLHRIRAPGAAASCHATTASCRLRGIEHDAGTRFLGAIGLRAVGPPRWGGHAVGKRRPRRGICRTPSAWLGSGASPVALAT